MSTSTRMNDLIPATSPLLRPSDRHRNSADSFSLSNIRNEDIPLDDLEFLAPGDWQEEEHDDDSEEDDDDESLDDFTLEDGHIQGVPSCSSVFHAKQYHTPEFHASLLELLRDDLRVLGWSNLPADLPASLIHIHKVSGSLTNAVFFVSIPATEFEINAEGAARPLTPPATNKPATVLSELERGRATPTPGPGKTLHEGQKITIEAPTLLLRVYGPSSGSLISRRTELHILHTLSSAYAIGPRVLGTFANGRVEEYFHSRALHKEEMRDARISRWIGRRMRELHRVDLGQMEPPSDGRNSRESSRSRSGSAQPERPSLENVGQGQSGSSIYSTSSGSSIFSFGSSYSAASTRGSFSSSTHGGSSSDLTSTLTQSPLLMPQRYPSESRAESKKRSRSSLVLRRKGAAGKDKLGVWENITRWTREAKLVLKTLDELAQTPGFDQLLEASVSRTSSATETTIPLASLARTLELRAQLDLPLFEQQIKTYRSFVRDWERQEGKSKRVFAHNDTQYGNLLLLTPAEEGEEKEVEKSLKAPHQKIIVVDFEYASANPRAFDIANHFIEWRADYHHPTLSHSLSSHGGYPSSSERARFLRAYVGCDGGLDTSSPSSASTEAQEDPRVLRLEEEVKIWEPSSHAMWAVWGIVQGKEDLLAQVAKWKKACLALSSSASASVEKGVEQLNLVDKEGKGTEQGGARPKLHRGKSGEVVDAQGNEVTEEEKEEAPVVDFDYLSYARERVALFREDAGKLGVF